MMKFLSEKSLTNKQIRFFIILSIIVNAVGLFSPVLGSNDSNFYAVVAKHIIESGNWVNLTFDGKDWLDKPHLPFWIIAVSYKLFGVHAFSYILPGFIFNLLGAFYTYLLAKHIFGSKEIGLLASLFYMSALHILLSSVDVRQEAYLLGEIMPACYYWYLYNETDYINKKYLLIGALFTAFAMMTKGVFVLVVIFSGLICVWLYTRSFRNFISKKWFLALLLSFIFILPELLALYVQFDLHPEKIVYDKTGVSGIKWFFWGSQFGRFFNTGPITNGVHASYSHYFYYVHTFLWAFLPWTLILPYASWNMLKSIRVSTEVPENLQNKQLRLNYVYILGSFLPTFIMFSLTKFQLDHYTNILTPFVAILCADWVFNKATRLTNHPLFYLQPALAYLLCASVLVLSLIMLNGKLFIVVALLCGITIIIFVMLTQNYPLTKAIIFPVLSINLVFVFLMGVNAKLYSKYDVGYQVSQYEKQITPLPLIDYNVNSLSMELFNHTMYKRIHSYNDLLKENKPFYLLISEGDWKNILIELQNTSLESAQFNVLETFMFIKQDKFIPTLFNTQKRINDTKAILLIKINS